MVFLHFESSGNKSEAVILCSALNDLTCTLQLFMSIESCPSPKNQKMPETVQVCFSVGKSTLKTTQWVSVTSNTFFAAQKITVTPSCQGVMVLLRHLAVNNFWDPGWVPVTSNFEGNSTSTFRGTSPMVFTNLSASIMLLCSIMFHRSWEFLWKLLIAILLAHQCPNIFWHTSDPRQIPRLSLAWSLNIPRPCNGPFGTIPFGSAKNHVSTAAQRNGGGSMNRGTPSHENFRSGFSLKETIQRLGYPHLRKPPNVNPDSASVVFKFRAFRFLELNLSTEEDFGLRYDWTQLN